MAPAFRLTTRPVVSENMSQYTVDFSTERAGLQRLYFLPGESVPGGGGNDITEAAILALVVVVGPC